MATVSQLVNEVEKIVQDSSFSQDDIVGYLDDGLKIVAAGPVMHDYKSVQLPPLPRLYTSDTIDCSTTTYYVDLSDLSTYTFGRDLDFASNGTTGSRITVQRSMQDFMKSYPEMDESGSVYRVFEEGGRLYHQGIPSEAETLTLWFYRVPTTLSIDSPDAEPEGIPSQFHHAILTNYAAWRIFSLIDGDNGELRYTIDKHWTRYEQSLHDLYLTVGDKEKEPVNIADTDWDTMGYYYVR